MFLCIVFIIACVWELNCISATVCPFGQLKCGKKCVWDYDVCLPKFANSAALCPNQEDLEKICTPEYCHALGMRTCNNLTKKCIWDGEFCDSKKDCPNGHYGIKHWVKRMSLTLVQLSLSSGCCLHQLYIDPVLAEKCYKLHF